MSIHNKQKVDFRKMVEDISEMRSKNFRNIAFSTGVNKLQYFKLIEMKSNDKDQYFKSVEKRAIYSEWAFEISKHKFNVKDTTRININDKGFLLEALMQVKNATAVKVIEEIDFDHKREEKALQYFKIISKDNLKKELKSEFENNPYSFSNGKRYSLSRLKEVQQIASKHNGVVVKVTETFVDRNELY